MSSSSLAPRMVGLLFFLVAAGCVGGESGPPREPPVTGATQGGAIGLDLRSLEQQLRDTKAIGVFTKISLKNQVDDLLTQFREFHQGQTGVILGELRERYNLLLLKVLSLLQGDEPALPQAVGASREAIWGILADPVKFAAL